MCHSIATSPLFIVIVYIALDSSIVSGEYLTINNAGFELDQGTLSPKTYYYQTLSYWSEYDPFSVMGYWSIGVANPRTSGAFDDPVFSDGTPEGHKYGWLEADPNSQEYGIYQKLTAYTVTADTRYTLSVYIANHDGGCWVGSDSGCWSARGFPGYKTQFLAIANDNAISILAEDDNGLSIGEGTWAQSIVIVTVLSGNEHIGKTLGIRIINKNLASSKDVNIGFDDVKLEAIMLTESPTQSPTAATLIPTKSPTQSPTAQTAIPTQSPSLPTQAPTAATTVPTKAPTQATTVPTAVPTKSPTKPPTHAPSGNPSISPTESPTKPPTHLPTTHSPTPSPATTNPTESPTTTLHSQQPIDKPTTAIPTQTNDAEVNEVRQTMSQSIANDESQVSKNGADAMISIALYVGMGMGVSAVLTLVIGCFVYYVIHARAKRKAKSETDQTAAVIIDSEVKDQTSVDMVQNKASVPKSEDEEEMTIEGPVCVVSAAALIARGAATRCESVAKQKQPSSPSHSEHDSEELYFKENRETANEMDTDNGMQTTNGMEPTNRMTHQLSATNFLHFKARNF